ncbi:collagen-binding protein [Cytophagales bacterium WSM2-2]|nr:collagen-binding protein [Cytophagales bacterium WSM2-2]
MHNRQDDIIRYRNGEMSAQEMHALERKALNDPFLADALEGIENISAENLASDIEELNRKIAGEKRRSLLFTPLRIAAGVVLVTASVFLLYKLTPKKENLALKNEKNSPADSSISKKDEQNQPVEEAKKKEPTAASGEIKVATKSESKPVRQEAPKPETNRSDSKLDDHANLAVAQAEDEKKIVDQVSVVATQQAPVVVDKVKEAPAPELQVTEKELEKKKEVKEEVSRSFAAQGAGLARKTQQQAITGRVISAEDGSPLPGVNVTIEGTKEGTMTDGNGYFTLPKKEEQERLVFSFIGLQSEEVDATGKDKMDDVRMKQDVTQLNEVVVTAYGGVRDADEKEEPVIHIGSPIGGRRAFSKYLDTNVRYTEEALKNNVKGKVKVEFDLHSDGSFDGYRVVKSLGHGCDEELIRLIKDGPKWLPTTENGKPVESKVIVGLRFNPAKSGK